MDNAINLTIEDLHVTVGGVPILKGLNLEVPAGEVHALMGPNGSGKTTLAFTVMGHPRYQVTRGRVTMGGVDLLSLSPEKRARAGLFLAFQYPSEIPGVTLSNFLRTALNAGREEEMTVWDFHALMREKMEFLDMDPAFATRYVNEGFSGGEKKRAEMLQMTMLEPKIAVLDEPDSGLDVDAVKVVAKAVNSMRGPAFGGLVITHYNRILRYIEPDRVHVMVNGRVVLSGGPELALAVEEKGYDWVREEAGLEETPATAGAVRSADGGWLP